MSCKSVPERDSLEHVSITKLPWNLLDRRKSFFHQLIEIETNKRISNNTLKKVGSKQVQSHSRVIRKEVQNGSKAGPELSLSWLTFFHKLFKIEKKISRKNTLKKRPEPAFKSKSRANWSRANPSRTNQFRPNGSRGNQSRANRSKANRSHSRTNWSRANRSRANQSRVKNPKQTNLEPAGPKLFQDLSRAKIV